MGAVITQRAQQRGADNTGISTTSRRVLINRGFWEPLSQYILSLWLQAENVPTYWMGHLQTESKQTANHGPW
eukprot:1582337-Prymnesium_polylepis.2